MDLDRLTIPLDGLDCDALLADWGWILADGLRPHSLTVFGDWFLEADDGRIAFLDTMRGDLLLAAHSRAELLELRELPENREDWYQEELATACLAAGLVPGSGQCLSFVVPPILGGKLDASNVEVADLAVNQSILAQIHEQTQNAPDDAVDETDA